jgi:hypothetical protein
MGAESNVEILFITSGVGILQGLLTVWSRNKLKKINVKFCCIVENT